MNPPKSAEFGARDDTELHFNALSESYHQSRRGYLSRIMADCAEIAARTARGSCPFILDVGCGTGISTRALAALGSQVIGVDADLAMIKEALADTGPRVAYACCDAKSIPWNDHTFDAIVSFGAFHWFASDGAVAELYRLLRPGGALIIVNKIDKGDLRKIVRSITAKYGSSVRDPKVGYNPAKLLKDRRFKGVCVTNVHDREIYAPGELAAHIRTMAPWGMIRPPDQEFVMREILTAIAPNNSSQLFVERPLRCRIVIGYKPKQ